LVENHPVENLESLKSFDAVVVAAGAWSNQLGIGLPPVEPIKGHLIAYGQPPGKYRTILRHGHTYLLQRTNGLLIAGSSEEHLGFDRSVDGQIVSDIASRAAFVVPSLAGEALVESWTGLRPASETPHTGAYGPGGRLFLAYGHYRNGILLAPITARDLAAEISASFEKH